MSEVLKVVDPNGQNPDRKAIVAKRLAEVEAMLAIVNAEPQSDVPVTKSTSAETLMAAVLASGGVGTK